MMGTVAETVQADAENNKFLPYVIIINIYGLIAGGRTPEYNQITQITHKA